MTSRVQVCTKEEAEKHSCDCVSCQVLACVKQVCVGRATCIVGEVVTSVKQMCVDRTAFLWEHLLDQTCSQVSLLIYFSPKETGAVMGLLKNQTKRKCLALERCSQAWEVAGY